MKKEEIISKIGNLAQFAQVVERKGIIEIPYHRLPDWKAVQSELESIGFTRTPMAFEINFEKEQAVPAPTMREIYEKMSANDKAKADAWWVSMGGTVE